MNIAEKIARAKTDYDEVYDAGRVKGKQITNQYFTDTYQEKGERTVYSRAFCGPGWTDELYALMSYPIKPTISYQMFYNSNLTNVCNVDFSKSTNLQKIFTSCPFLNQIGVIDARNCNDLEYAFEYAKKLHTIWKIIVNKNCKFKGTFHDCRSLVYCIMEGEIGNDIDFGDCPLLSGESLESIFSVLSKTTSGKTLTLNYNAQYQFTGERWLTLINSVSNWTISVR